jgi:hypothetical protein
VVGGEPDNIVNQRAVALRQETGTFADATATMTLLPGRTDWTFAAAETFQPTVATLGEFPGAAEQFRAAISRWAASEQFPATHRVALGVVLAEPTETRETGYQRLRDFIGAVPDGDTSDFLYQVNRHRPTRADVPELRVNRLAKWSVQQVQLVTLSAGGAPVSAPPLSFVSLELDVNTSAEFSGPIPRGVVASLVDDLWAGATEIATEGDRVR